LRTGRNQVRKQLVAGDGFCDFIKPVVRPFAANISYPSTSSPMASPCCLVLDTRVKAAGSEALGRYAENCFVGPHNRLGIMRLPGGRFAFFHVVF